MPLHDLKTALSVDSAREISTNNILTWLFEDAQTDSPAGSTGQSKLAIVGMSCRLPGGATVSPSPRHKTVGILLTRPILVLGYRKVLGAS